MSLVPVNGPTDLPELRNWLLQRFRPGGVLQQLDGAFISRALEAGQLWWVEEETCHLLAESAPTWPDDAELDLHNIPAKAGLAIFAHDIVGMDAETGDYSVRVSGIVWGPVTLPPMGATPLQRAGKDYYLEAEGRTALGIGMFTRLDLHEGLDKDDLMRGIQTIGPLAEELLQAAVTFEGGEGVLTHRDQIVATTFTTGGNEGTLYSYLGRTDWMDGWRADVPVPDSPRAGNPNAIASMAEDRKLLAALFAITRASSVVQKMHHRPPRHVARRSERKKLTADVMVLRLGGEHKQNVGYSPPQPKRDWKHSWIVTPHFRWQACGPQWTERKLILIGPYTKGDTTKPLLGANRVWRVVPPGEKLSD